MINTENKVLAALDKLKVPSGADEAEVKTRKRKVEEIYEYCASFAVTDATSCAKAEEISKRCAQTEKDTKAPFKVMLDHLEDAKRSATAAKKEFDDFLAALLAPITEGKREIDAKARAWREQERKRIEDENARKRREAEAKAEQERSDKIKALKADGSKESKDAAKRLASEPLEVDPIQEEKMLESTSGIVHQEHWIARQVADDVITLRTLVAAAAKDPKYLKYLSINQTVVNAAARTEKLFFDVPGFAAENVGKTAHR